MSRTIIALVGPKGCGKSTLALSLTGHEHKFITLGFAEPLKRMIQGLFLYQGLEPKETVRMIRGDLKEVPTPYLGGRTPRHAMQTLGTEWRDLIARNLWSDIWLRTVSDSLRDCNIVVDDMRFHHEAEAVRSLGGHIFLIQREGQDVPNDPHISEQEYRSIEFDGFIVNFENRPEAMLDQLLALLPEGSTS